MSDKIFQIAIDGPGGAGKSTIAKKVAAAAKAEYVDTGAMYRAMAYKLHINGIDFHDEKSLRAMLDDTDIDFVNGDILLDGASVEDKIRTPEISKMAATISQNFFVREKLVTIQRELAKSKSVVMDGRDIGSNVLPDATYKFYMTASAEERAYRRYEQLKQKSQGLSFDEVLRDIRERDFQDMNRELNPLVKAKDALEIDTTDMSIEEVVNKILGVIEKKWR